MSVIIKVVDKSFETPRMQVVQLGSYLNGQVDFTLGPDPVDTSNIHGVFTDQKYQFVLELDETDRFGGVFDTLPLILQVADQQVKVDFHFMSDQIYQEPFGDDLREALLDIIGEAKRLHEKIHIIDQQKQRFAKPNQDQK